MTSSASDQLRLLHGVLKNAGLDSSQCSICHRLMNDPADPTSLDCGGDCLKCMAEVAEDPDCVATMAALAPPKSRAGWYYYTDPEWCHGPEADREDAIAAGRDYFPGEWFTVCYGVPFKNRTVDFSDWVGNRFDDINEEYSGDDYASSKWSSDHRRELYTALEKTMDDWLDRHGYREAWALDCTQEEDIEPEPEDDADQ